jgi:hypothetical protein
MSEHDYIQEMIKMQESVRKMLEPPDYVRRMIEEQESLRKIYEHHDYVQEMIKKEESLRKMFEPPDYIRRIIEEQESFREIFAPGGSAATALTSLINQEAFNPLDITERIRNFADELSIPDFYINNEGFLSFEEQSINVFELNSAVHTFFDKISEECSIENVLSLLAALKRPVQRIAIWILNNIIVAFIISVMAGIFTQNIQNFLDLSSFKSRREVLQKIKCLPPEIDTDKYKGYRVVTANILNLRRNPKIKSQIVAKLKRGKLVRLVQKKKNWTKVEVEISDSAGVVMGWVATRYIVPLKPLNR